MLQYFTSNIGVRQGENTLPAWIQYNYVTKVNHHIPVNVTDIAYIHQIQTYNIKSAG